jgi:VIT1/CCC1 family predicted Fe2+/Mn2+ transporter
MPRTAPALLIAALIAVVWAEERAPTLGARGCGLVGSRLALTRGGGSKARVTAAPSARLTFKAACTRVANDHMRGIIFGGLDGILTTFAIMAASIGARQSATTTIVIGVSTLLADALSMAGGEYLSAKAEQECLAPRARLVAGEPSPLAKGSAMFVAFLLFGAIPLLGFILSNSLARYLPGVQHDVVTGAVTVLALFGLGAVKSQFGKMPWWRSGGEVVLVGGAAASVAYTAALVADHVVSN